MKLQYLMKWEGDFEDLMIAGNHYVETAMSDIVVLSLPPPRVLASHLSIGWAQDGELFKWTGKSGLDGCQILVYSSIPSSGTLLPLLGKLPEVNL